MKDIGGTSRFIGFFDECGDHSLVKIDPDFPVFVLALVIIERAAYAETVIPALGKLKMRYWNHEGINLHSRDIRKAKGPFSFLQVPAMRTSFLADMSRFMTEMPYTLFVTGIHKDKHLARYKHPENPYSLALAYTLERVLHFMDAHDADELPLVAEARGKQEDESLSLAFYRIVANGTAYHSAKEFQRFTPTLMFRSKRDNVAGVQIADLCAHPSARHMLKPQQPNQAYDIVKGKIYHSGKVSGWQGVP